jgi:hypothetical protein
MATGVPVRLSAQLAERARKAAEIQERSLTQQVEHWARMGELLDEVINRTGIRLKAASHDPDLQARLAAADTAEGKRRTRELITSRGGPWYSVDPSDRRVLIRREVDGTETRGRSVNGRFVADAPARPKRARRS